MLGQVGGEAVAFESEVAVTLDCSDRFARLSGDYNPLHVDSVAARRLRFGGTVAHGIHLFLSALDAVAARNVFEEREPAALFATFDSPVLTDTVVHVQASLERGKLRIAAEAAGERAFTATIELGAIQGREWIPKDAEFAPADPEPVEFPPQVSHGHVPLQLSRALLAELFPSLAKVGSRGWIADLLATTHIVGMRCPGMHSIYSSFRLRRTQRTGYAEAAHYSISGMEKRFQLLRLELTGACLEGTVETFFRPRPVTQHSMKDVAAAVGAKTLAGHRVLIVGGSRGLGELTAKIAAAAGAEVTITYARGQADADRVCAEIGSLAGSCAARCLDVAQLGGTIETESWLKHASFTHVYFFASPFIARNAGRWSDGLFMQFANIYVRSFAVLVEGLIENGTAPRPSFLYPSSTFVAQPETGFAEYAAAKSAGETLCDQLRHRYRLRVARPRLPRLRTDQTSALTDIGALDPLPVMLDLVRDFHSP